MSMSPKTDFSSPRPRLCYVYNVYPFGFHAWLLPQNEKVLNQFFLKIIFLHRTTFFASIDHGIYII